jgi:uncharacterized membrane protein
VRQALIRQLYVDPDASAWQGALSKLGVDYVAVGTLERQLYGPQVDTRFEGVLEPAYPAGSTGATMLYRAPKSSP